MTDARAEIADVLRGRLLRGLHAGTLGHGERLPSARDLRHEFDVDHRIVVDAYRILEREGLVELRPRGGVYVSASPGPGMVPIPSPAWLSDFLTQAVAREIPLREIHDWLRRAVESRRLRAVAVQSTADGIAGLCRELRDDYGLEASGIDVRALTAGTDLPPELRYADLLLTTTALESVVAPVAQALRKKLVVTTVRPDLIGGEWRLLLRRPVYVVVRDAAFIPLLQDFFAETPGADNLRYILLGRDPVDSIPDGAPVYVTSSAREALRGVQVPGRILPAVRLLSPQTSREIVEFIVRANLDVVAGSHLVPPR